MSQPPRLPPTVLLLSTFLFVGLLNPNGSGAPAKRAGAPGDGTGVAGDSGTCNDVGCHNTFALNSGSGTVGLTLPASYLPGDTLSVEIVVQDANAARFGFEITAQDLTQSPVGLWIPGPGTRTTTANTNYLTHAGATDQSIWTAEWIAPASAVGAITFYVAGNAADGRFSASNDHIYASSQVVQDATTVGRESVPLPRIEWGEMWPNPVSGVATVSYRLAQPAIVRWRVADVVGRTVRSGVAAARSSGTHQIRWNSDGLGPGLYLFEFSTGTDIRTQPVIVAR